MPMCCRNGRPVISATRFDLSPEQVRRVFMGLTVQEHRAAVQRWIGDDSRRLPMFRDAEIATLVPQLVEALAHGP